MAVLNKFTKDNKIGYKDNNGNIIIQPIYTSGQSYFGKDTYKKSEYASVAKGELCGIINEKGEEIIPFEYEEVYHLFDDLFAARKKTRFNDWCFGVIDSNSNIIIPFVYKHITHLGKYIKCTKKVNSERKSSFQIGINSDGLMFDYKNINDVEWANPSGAIIYKGNAIESEFGYLIISNENSLGVIDPKGSIIISPKYEEIHFTQKDRIVARINSDDNWSFGVIDNKENIIIPFDYKFISSKSSFFYECYKHAICKKENNIASKPYEYRATKEVSWFNRDGIKICNCNAKILSNDFLGVCSNGKWGVYNQSNTRILNYLYDDVMCVQNKFIVSKDDQIGILDENGRIIITPSYYSIECVSINDEDYIKDKIISFGKFSKKYKYDTEEDPYRLFKKRIYFKTQYTGAHKDLAVSAPESFFDFDKYFILSRKDYSEIFSIESGILANSRFSNIKQLTDSLFAVKNNEKWGIYSAIDSKLLLDCIYERIVFEGKNVVLLQQNGLWGAKSLISPSNFLKLLLVDVPIKFKEITILDEYENLFGVKIESLDYQNEPYEEYTIVDHNGDSFIKMYEFSKLDKQCLIIDSNYDRILTSKNNKYGFISAQGYITIPFQYDDIELRKDGRFDVRIGECWGVIDISGKEIVTIKYSDQLPIELKDTIVKNANTGRYGVLSIDGSEKVPSIYEHIMIKEGFIIFGYGGCKGDTFFSDIIYAKWGIMDNNGSIIIQPKYDCYKFQDGFILAGRSGGFLYHEESECGTDYSGVYDLYTSSGELIFGGFDEFGFNKENKIYCFMLGGEWETYTDFIEACYVHVSDYYFNDMNCLWLILDKDLKPVLKNNNEKHFKFKKGFICNIKKEVQNKKKTIYCNMPLGILTKWYRIDNDFIIIESSSAINIHSGKQTPFYQDIKVVDSSTLFFVENNKVGIRDIDKIIKPAEYLFLTNPEQGFFFAAKELDEEFSSLELLSIYNQEVKITSIERIKTSKLIDFVALGKLRIILDYDNTNLNSIIVSQHDIFDDSFVKIISDEESNYNCTYKNDIYWYSGDQRLKKEKYTSDYDVYYDPNNYAEETWVALTDGMYGDYPGGDADYETIGF